jgi:glycosyltransferase involved in cell wall biosynthesis
MVAVSQHVGATLEALNPRAAVEVIGNGVPPAAGTTRRPPGPDVLFVGRLEIAQKGLDLLVEAFALAAPRIAGDLVIVGAGPDGSRVRELVERAGLTDRVRFAGPVDGAGALALMAGSRLVAMPSRYETFGMVAVEALATGTPVVAFDIDGLREVLPVGCTVRVPAFDVRAYADALVRAHRDERWIAAAAGPARRFAAGYDWDVLAARQEAVYRDVARTGATR